MRDHRRIGHELQFRLARNVFEHTKLIGGPYQVQDRGCVAWRRRVDGDRHGGTVIEESAVRPHSRSH